MESSIIRAILRHVASLPAAKAIKTHGSAYSEAGTPDILALIGGTLYAVEVKQPGKAPTALQETRLRQWADAGAVTGVVTSLAEFKVLLDGRGD